jgi:hypothetical protein
MLWLSALCKGKLSTALLALQSHACARSQHSIATVTAIGKMNAGFVARAKLHLRYEEPAAEQG